MDVVVPFYLFPSITLRGLPALALMALLGLALPAQASSTLPSASPERRLPQPGQLPEQLAAPGLPASATAMPMAPRPAHAEQIPLTVSAVTLKGATVYSTERLAPLWQGLLGAPKTLADLYDVADAITRFYRNKGYVMARAFVPAQEIGGGAVVLVVDEGRIGKVEMQGDFGELPIVTHVLTTLRAMPVLNIKMVEHEMLLLNDLPGSTFRVVLLPGQDGQINLVVVGESDPVVAGEVEFDNSGTRYLGPYLANASLRLANLFGPLQQTRFDVSAATQLSELAMLSFEHVMPVGLPEVLLTLEGALTRGQPGYTLTSNDIDSRTGQLDAHIDWSVLRQRTDSLILTSGLTWRNSKTDVLGSAFSEDKVRVAYVGVRYDWQDFLNGYNLAQLTFSQGLSGFLGGSHSGDTNLSRAAGRSDFSKLSLSLLRNQPLTSAITLFGALRAQLANAPLLSSEEFGYGGHFIGRAYDSSEKTGDSGVSVLAEARYRVLTDGKLTVQPFVFADYVALWNRDSGQDRHDEGASAGVGLYLSRGNLQGRVTVAQPLISSAASTYSNKGGPRLLFSLKATF